MLVGKRSRELVHKGSQEREQIVRLPPLKISAVAKLEVDLVQVVCITSLLHVVFLFFICAHNAAHVRPHNPYHKFVMLQEFVILNFFPPSIS